MGVSYGKLMMWFFLLSDAFTFSGLLITYGLIRSSHPAYTGLHEAFTFSHEYWPVPEKVYEAVPFLHGLQLPLLFVGLMTFILIMSSVTMVLAVEAGHRMDRKAVEKWMLWKTPAGNLLLFIRIAPFTPHSHRVPCVREPSCSMAQNSLHASLLPLPKQH